MQGRVSDATGQAINGASVVAFAEGVVWSPATRLDSRDGRFALTALKPGVYEVAVVADGYLTHTVRGVVVTDGGRIDLGQLTAQRAATIRGTVSTYPSSAEGVQIVAYRNGIVVATARPAENGGFEFARLPDGDYRLEAIRGLVITSATIRLAIGEVRTDATLDLAIGAAIQVQVSRTGMTTPAAGVNIFLGSGSDTILAGVTDASGSVTFPGVGVGAFTVSAETPAGVAEQRIEITPTDAASGVIRSAELVLEPGTTLRGHTDKSHAASLGNTALSAGHESSGTGGLVNRRSMSLT